MGLELSIVDSILSNHMNDMTQIELFVDIRDLQVWLTEWKYEVLLSTCFLMDFVLLWC
jgi:hypothetical protein